MTWRQRRKHQTEVAIATVMAPFPNLRFFGYDISRVAHVRSARMYRVLDAWMERGWLVDGWEDNLPLGTKRPPRRFYTPTEAGAAGMRELLGSVEGLTG